MSIKYNTCDSIAFWHFVPLQHSNQNRAVSVVSRESSPKAHCLVCICHQYPFNMHGLQLQSAVFKCHLHSVIQWMPVHTHKKGEEFIYARSFFYCVCFFFSLYVNYWPQRTHPLGDNSAFTKYLSALSQQNTYSFLPSFTNIRLCSL